MFQTNHRFYVCFDQRVDHFTYMLSIFFIYYTVLIISKKTSPIDRSPIMCQMDGFHQIHILLVLFHKISCYGWAIPIMPNKMFIFIPAIYKRILSFFFSFPTFRLPSRRCSTKNKIFWNSNFHDFLLFFRSHHFPHDLLLLQMADRSK